MPAYLIGLMDITNPLEFANYTQAAGRALEPFAGRFKRLFGKPQESIIYEGERPANYMFLIEFESREVFEQFYHSDAYQEALRIRLRCSVPKTLMLMEGIPPLV